MVSEGHGQLPSDDQFLALYILLSNLQVKMNVNSSSSKRDAF